jgi:hypothetical protein
MEPVAGSIVHYAEQTLYILISDRLLADTHGRSSRWCLFSNGLTHVLKYQTSGSNSHVRVLA